MPLQLYKKYHPVDVARELGERYGPQWVQTGIVTLPGRKLLFVTLEKGELRPQHHYADLFVSDDVFEWESQSSQSHSTPAGRVYVEHSQRGVEISLFVRRTRRTASGQVRPYVYLGPVKYESSRGNKPMTVRWKLSAPLPRDLYSELGLAEPRAETLAAQRVLTEDPVTWPIEAHPEPNPESIAELKSAIEGNDHSAKERWALQRIRVGVRGFRETVLTNFDHACAVCGMDEEALLDAAHVKTWAEDEGERLNPANGIALCVLHHRAYDRNLIMIQDDGSINVAAWVARSDNPAVAASMGGLGGRIRTPRFPVNLARRAAARDSGNP